MLKSINKMRLKLKAGALSVVKFTASLYFCTNK